MSFLSRAVITEPPTFPGTRPRKAPLQPIQHPHNILTQFQEDWMLHTHWTGEFIHMTIRAIAGIPGAGDQAAVEDFYRTNRFDIASHWNRALSAAEPTNITTVDQITGKAGRMLVSLLDQHISLAGAVGVKLMDAKGIFTAQQKRDNLQGTIVKSLGLIEKASDYAAFDPVVGEFANGEKIVRLLANVYDNVQNKTTNDVAAANDAAYDAFNKAVEEDPYFAALRPELVKYLTENNIPLLAPAQDVWSTHLLQAVLTASGEADFTKATLPSGATKFFFFRDNKYRTASFEKGFAARSGSEQLQLHTFHIANLFALSTGLSSTAAGRTGFPDLALSDLQYLQH